MKDEFVTQRLKRLEKYIYGLKAAKSLNMLSYDERQIVLDITQNISLARSQVDFSFADEDVIAQRKGFRLAVEQLQAVIDGILEAGGRDLIDTVDITQLTVNAEICIDQLNNQVLGSRG
jgi:hypothetical protein